MRVNDKTDRKVRGVRLGSRAVNNLPDLTGEKGHFSLLHRPCDFQLSKSAGGSTQPGGQ